MDLRGTLSDLMLHMEWADSAVWSAVRKFSGADDASLAQLLNHLHMTQSAFLTTWTGKPFDRGFLRDRTLVETEQLAREYHREAARFMADVDEKTLDRPLNLPWADRFVKGASSTTLGDTIIQITSHSTYHRGQVNKRFRELGGDPPLVDYIAWLWLARPKPNWPA